ncbi:Ubiquinone/menaquinone biosynthesis C-methylase UbiE [Cribrihabitans marinus]|uniref:Ubiquinone/menaquinone biosynthesis C-methylase UbiE n=1 Tax=Cribrihabitans marinus TaxID=1227549 RepID=A0A1H7DSL5_9RHOB|nr:class I SAM-dependent methyltransferase [Cribrihabitans marinus]SEK02672.1 Ubiquinone/menaquinone biosynthesis C-methylase UbiE [Cribrihabitans marinus]
MPDTDSDFTGSIPEIYDSHLVPILFAGYADDLARRAARGDPKSVLELAAGSGAVTRALAPRLDGNARYVVTDLNAAMLERARQHHDDDRLDWQAADALALPFDDDSFDVVLCQFGVMFFPDRPAGFAEARRVLRPGGRFVFNSWGPIEKNDFSNRAVATLMRLYPEDPPQFLARTPFGYSQAARIEADLAAAGFGDVRIAELEMESHAAQARDFAFGQSYGSPLRLEIEARSGPTLEQVEKAITEDIARDFGAAPAAGRMSALVAEATAP